MTRLSLRTCVIALAAALAAAPPAGAQSSDLARAILALPSTVAGDQRQFSDARLYGGLVQAVITNQTGTAQDFLGADLISFLIAPRTGANVVGEGFTTPFTGTRDQFEGWARDNASNLLAVLFPSGLSSGLSGRDTAQLYSQQFLLTTALGTDQIRQSSPRGRFGAGGLAEYERFTRDGQRDGDSGWAWQGLYGFGRTLSVQGRFAQQRDGLTTRATSVTADYHPFIEINQSATWRVGATARSGFLYSQSRGSGVSADEGMRIGSIDVGGGAWTSVRKDLGRARIGGGALVQGTKNYIPPGEAGTFRSAFATALNARGVAYDVTYGTTAGVDATASTTLIAKFAETRSVGSAIDRPASRTILAGVSYAVGPGSAFDAGFKVTSFAGTLAQSVFFQGNFGW